MTVIRVSKKEINLVRSYAPARVDLGGGSLDLWPIGVIIKDSLTVNCAMNLFARVEARRIKGKHLRLISEDFGFKYDFHPQNPPNKMPLVEEICSHYGVTEGWEISLRSDFPSGSGLGGSSAISVALAKALLAIKEQKEDVLRTVYTLRDLEARNLKIPTGVQDFLPPIFGGALAIHYKLGYEDIESLGQVFPFLNERIVVAYTQKSHISSDTNYQLYRSFLDGDKKVVKAMENIAEATKGIYKSLKDGDFEKAGEEMLQEWQNRKKLSPKISTKKMEEIEKASLKAGALGVKGCGAAGGGSMVFLVKLGMKRSVELAIEKCGATVLNCEPCNEGCTVEVSK